MVVSDNEFLTLDPELKAIFEATQWPKPLCVTRETLHVARKVFETAAKCYNTSKFARQILGRDFDCPTWVEEDCKIDVRDGTIIKVRIYRPNRASSPVVVQCHGGGWFMGSLETDALICRIFCSRLGLTVVNVDYRVYPEVKFGIPTLDFYDAVRWTAKNIHSFGGDIRQGFVLSGNSGGGTFAAIAAHLARDDGIEPGISGCFLTCPILSDQYLDEHGQVARLFDPETEYRSWTQNANAPLLNEKTRLSALTFADFDLSSNLFTPFHFPSHHRLPPTYIVACGLDMYRDGCFLYQRELEKAGVPTRLDFYPRLPHCWWTSYPQTVASQRWVRNVIAGMKWLLKSEEVPRLGTKL